MKLAIDTETTGPDLHHGCLPFAVAMMDNEGEAFYFEWPVSPHTRQPKVPKRDKARIKRLIYSYERWVFHHSKYDIHALSRIGIDLPDWPDRFEDTLPQSHVFDSYNSHGLKDLAARFLDIPADDEKGLRKFIAHCRDAAKRLGWAIGPSVGWDYWLPSAYARHLLQKKTERRASFHGITAEALLALTETYALQDVKRTILLNIMFDQALKSEKLEQVYQREKKLLPIIYEMEERGITLRPKLLKAEIARYNQAREDHKATCEKLAARFGLKDFNVQSGPQKIKLIYENIGLPVIKETDSGQPSTDSKTLETLLEKHTPKLPKTIRTFAADYLDHQLLFQKNKTAHGYLTGYQERAIRHAPNDVRLHYSLNPNGTRTTRLTGQDPNPQNVGNGEDDVLDENTGEIIEAGDFKLRKVYGPRAKRCWWCYDYEQLQLRILAYASEDKRMIRGFEQGYNFHLYMASQIFKKDVNLITKNEKRIGKNVNFGFVFGAGPAKIEATAGMPGLYKTVQKLFPNASKFMDQMIHMARKQGYIKTLGGYRLSVPNGKYYVATNYFVQGTEGDIVKNAMIEIDVMMNTLYPKNRDTNYRNPYLTLQVHDELVFDFPIPATAKEKMSQRLTLKTIKTIMESCGSELGVVTPVNVEVARDNWKDTEKISL